MSRERSETGLDGVSGRPPLASGLRSAVAFLTPVGGARPAVPEALGWLGPAGLAIGAVLGVLWWATHKAWPAAVAAGIVVAADLAITGLLHFDGLVDSADGLIAHLPAKRRLDVMAEPGVGAFGVGTGAIVLLLRVLALAALAPSIQLLAGLWCASRTLMATAALVVPYARPDGGLASAFLGPRRNLLPVVAPGAAASIALLLAWDRRAGGVVAAVALAGGVGVVAVARRRLGGFTGDVLGAAGLVAETLGLLVAAARW